MLTELGMRERMRRAVRAAGYVADASAWVPRSDVTAAVARVLGESAESNSLRVALRRLLVADGWRERRVEGGWQWRARRATERSGKS